MNKVAKSVKLYSTETCPYCIMEKRWLDANNIVHEVVYVDKDHAAAVQMVQNTGQMGVPVTEISYEDSTVKYIVGFDTRQLGELVKKEL